jgi:hypothetical protein
MSGLLGGGKLKLKRSLPVLQRLFLSRSCHRVQLYKLLRGRLPRFCVENLKLYITLTPISAIFIESATPQNKMIHQLASHRIDPIWEFFTQKTTCTNELLKRIISQKNGRKRPPIGGGTSGQATCVACCLGQIRHACAATPQCQQVSSWAMPLTTVTTGGAYRLVQRRHAGVAHAAWGSGGIPAWRQPADGIDSEA